MIIYTRRKCYYCILWYMKQELFHLAFGSNKLKESKTDGGGAYAKGEQDLLAKPVIVPVCQADGSATVSSFNISSFGSETNALIRLSSTRSANVMPWMVREKSISANSVRLDFR